MQHFAAELQRGGILREGGPRHKARRLLKGGKYAPLKKEPKRGHGPAGHEKLQRLKSNWEAKKYRKTKQWPSRGLGGYVADEDEVTDEVREEAKELRRSAFLLREYLKRPSFIHACEETGIGREDLLPKTMEDFQKADNRAFDRSFQEQRAAYEDHEEYRASLIQKVLVNEQRLRVAYEKKVALMKKEERQMQHLLEESIAQEKKRMEQSAAVNAKIERAKKYQQKAIARKARAKEEEFQRRERRARAALENNRKTIKTKIKTKAESRRQREVQAVERREAKVQRLTDQAEELRRAGRLRMEEIDAKMRAQKEEFLATRRSAKSLAGARAEREAQRAEELRRAQEEKLERKDALIQKIRADKERERQMRIFRSQLAMERKKKQAERLHIAQQRKVQALERQVVIRDKRAHALKEIKTAISIERNHVLRDARISLDEWKAANKAPRSAYEPGPGEYDLPDVFASRTGSPGMSGDGWSKRPKPKTEFDRIVDRAREIPAPGDFGEITDAHHSSFHTPGGEWGDYAKPKNEFEMAMARANDTPAAQDYNPQPLKSNVGSVNMNGEKPLDTPLDRVIRRANDTPAPDSYGKPAGPAKLRNLDQLRSQLNVSSSVLGFIAKMKSGSQKKNSTPPPPLSAPPRQSETSGLPKGVQKLLPQQQQEAQRQEENMEEASPQTSSTESTNQEQSQKPASRTEDEPRSQSGSPESETALAKTHKSSGEPLSPAPSSNRVADEQQVVDSGGDPAMAETVKSFPKSNANAETVE